MVEDPFSAHYSDLLDGTYDCVDRIVLNAYFPSGHHPGGFRNWWRRLFGDDENLDNTHLMRFAGRFSRRVRGWARKHDIPIIDCRKGDRKHEMAQAYLPSDPGADGIFAIFIARAPGSVWNVERSAKGTLVNLSKKKPLPFVNHFSFHIQDREWGHFAIKICPHPPFKAQVMLNGHEYVARQAERAKLAFKKEANCFTEVSDAADLQQIADTLCSPNTVGRLRQVCERWIYRCLGFALDFADQELTGFRYEYSVFQLESSRNLLFSRGSELERVFQGAIDRTRSGLDIPKLRTLFGSKSRPFRSAHQPHKCEVVVERPEYHLTIFKLRFGLLGLKIYSKGERVLRIEATAHNTKVLRLGRVIDKFPNLVEALNGMVLRFLESLHGIDVTWVKDTTLESLPVASQVGSCRVAGIQIEQARIRAVFQAVTALAPQPAGFTAGQVAEQVEKILQEPYRPRQAAYDLKKLRGKQLVTRIGKSRRYKPTEQGLRILVGIVTLRDKVIQPLLAQNGRLKTGRKPLNRHPLDTYYDAMQRDLRDLFGALNIMPN